MTVKLTNIIMTNTFCQLLTIFSGFPELACAFVCICICASMVVLPLTVP